MASTWAIVAGNDPGEAERDRYSLTAFIGQAEARVTGKVKAGDYLIPSGHHDGHAVAASPDALSLDDLAAVIGRVRHVNSESDTHTWVTVAVGLSRSDAAVAGALKRHAELLANQAQHTARLQSENQALAQRLVELETEQLALKRHMDGQTDAFRQVNARLERLFPDAPLVDVSVAGTLT